MSVVYKGFDTTLQREVAVKVLHPHLATKPESRKRLDREARAVARLHHPNILEVFDFSGADSTDAFIVTELIKGKTLREFISAEPFSPPEIAAMVMHEIAGALAHAHDAGVLHRDLKPENVMVRDDGVIKLTDFGIAKILDRDEKMTMTGALVGSPAHMAPEIIEGEEAGAEADVFSLGTMLYLFVTGKLPFTAPNTTATLKRILDCAFEDPRQTVPTVSDELAEIIATCLQRQPGSRYPNAGKLRDALASYLSELGLTRPHEELPKFFLDPKGFRRDLVLRVTSTLLERAQRLLAEKRSARALSALNQVLAHDPVNARAAELLGAMKTSKLREQRTRRLSRVASVSGAAFVIVMASLKGLQVARRVPEPDLPLSFGPQDVVLTRVVWPTADVSTQEPLSELDAGQSALAAGSVAVPPVRAVSRAAVVPVAVRVPEVKANVAAPSAAAIEVKVMVRPFGFLAVDQQPRSAEALSVHTLRLAPGPHTFTVSCDACESSGLTRSLQISASGDPITLPAPLKPSMVSFDGFPVDAVVQVGAESRTVAESRATPFRIVMPPEGRRAMVHEVPWSVTFDGKTVSGTARVEPGQLKVIGATP